MSQPCSTLVDFFFLCCKVIVLFFVNVFLSVSFSQFATYLTNSALQSLCQFSESLLKANTSGFLFIPYVQTTFPQERTISCTWHTFVIHDFFSLPLQVPSISLLLPRSHAFLFLSLSPSLQGAQTLMAYTFLFFTPPYILGLLVWTQVHLQQSSSPFGLILSGIYFAHS